MNQNSILMKNETEANRFAAKSMIVAIGFLALVFVMNLAKIFIVPIKQMSISLAIATILLIMPSVIVFVFKVEEWWVKYVTVTVASLSIGILSMYLSYHVVAGEIGKLAEQSQIAASSQELVASMEQVVSTVNVIDRTADELLDVVKER